MDSAESAALCGVVVSLLCLAQRPDQLTNSKVTNPGSFPPGIRVKGLFVHLDLPSI